MICRLSNSPEPSVNLRREFPSFPSSRLHGRLRYDDLRLSRAAIIFPARPLQPARRQTVLINSRRINVWSSKEHGAATPRQSATLAPSSLCRPYIRIHIVWLSPYIYTWARVRSPGWMDSFAGLAFSECASKGWSPLSPSAPVAFVIAATKRQRLIFAATK